MKIQVRKEKMKGGLWCAQFECTEVEDVLKLAADATGSMPPTVSMSRHGTGCPTSIVSLQDHNGHAPGFTSELTIAKGNLGGMDAYIQRIRDDVEALVKGLKVPKTKAKLYATPPTTSTDYSWFYWYTV